MFALDMSTQNLHTHNPTKSGRSAPDSRSPPFHRGLWLPRVFGAAVFSSPGCVTVAFQAMAGRDGGRPHSSTVRGTWGDLKVA